MMVKMDGFKRVLSVGVLGLATATLALGAPQAQARVYVDFGASAPPVVAVPPAVVAAPTVVAPPVGAAPPAVVAEPPLFGSVHLDLNVRPDDWNVDRTWRGYEQGSRQRRIVFGSYACLEG